MLSSRPFSTGHEMEIFESMLKRVTFGQPSVAMQNFAADVMRNLANDKETAGKLAQRNAAPLRYEIVMTRRRKDNCPDNMKRQNRNMACVSVYSQLG